MGLTAEAAAVEARPKHLTVRALESAAVGLFGKEVSEETVAESEALSSAQWALRDHLAGSEMLAAKIGKGSCLELHPGWCKEEDCDETPHLTKLLDLIKAILTRNREDRFRMMFKFGAKVGPSVAYMYSLVTGGRDNPKKFMFAPLKAEGKPCLAEESDRMAEKALGDYFLRTAEARFPIELTFPESEEVYDEETFMLPRMLTQWELTNCLAEMGPAPGEWRMWTVNETPLSRAQTKATSHKFDHGTPTRSAMPPGRARQKATAVPDPFLAGLRIAQQSVAATHAGGLAVDEIFGDSDDEQLRLMMFMEEGLDVALGDELEGGKKTGGPV